MQQYIKVKTIIKPQHECKFKGKCKVHPWNLGLLGFYAQEFEKFDLTPWSLVSLTKTHPQLVLAVKWHFIYCKISWIELTIYRSGTNSCTCSRELENKLKNMKKRMRHSRRWRSVCFRGLKLDFLKSSQLLKFSFYFQNFEK